MKNIKIKKRDSLFLLTDILTALREKPESLLFTDRGRSSLLSFSFSNSLLSFTGSGVAVAEEPERMENVHVYVFDLCYKKNWGTWGGGDLNLEEKNIF